MRPSKKYIMGYDIGDVIAVSLLVLLLLSAFVWGNLWMWAAYAHYIHK